MLQDQLNLTQIAQEAKKQSRVLKWLARVGIFMLGVCVVIFLIVPGAWNNFRYQGFFEDDTGWKPVDELVGEPHDVQVSPNGVVWVQTYNPDALNWWDGASWKTYDDFGIEGDQSLQNFTLDGEDVWATADRSVAHFDGEHWENFSNVLQDSPLDISAGLQGIFVISCNGDISRYYNGDWTITNAEDVLPGLESTSAYCAPRLLQTLDGSVWLEWFGIWKFDGDRWQHATITGAPSTNGVRLVGINRNGIWTSWGPHGLVWSTFDFSDWYVYDLDALGLSEEGRVQQVIDSSGKFVAATNEGLLQFEGEAWEKYTSPEAKNVSIFRVATMPDGKLWIATQSVVNPNLASILSALIVALLLSLAAFLISLIWVRHVQLQQAIRSRDYLQQRMPEIAQAKPTRMARLLYVFWTASLVGFGGLSVILSRIGTAGLILFGILLLSVVAGSVILWRKQHGQGADVKRTFLYVMPIIVLILWLVVLVMGLFVLQNTDGVIVVLFVVLWFGIMLFINLFPYWYVYKIPIGRGDYATALKRIGQLRRLQPDRIEYMFYQGAVLLLARQYVECEVILRDCVKRIRSNKPFLQAAALNNLCEALIGQGRYDEAVIAIESAIHMWPQLTTAYNSLAELYLEQGDNPGRALELIEFAQRYGSLNFMTRVFEPFHSSVTWALRGWALSKLNRTDEANQAVATAFQRMKSNFKPVMAALYYYSGRVKQQQGDATTAQGQFSHSVALDPTGIYGLRAKQILTTDYQL